MNDALKKLNKICKFAELFSKILLIALVIGAVVTLIIMGAVALNPDLISEIGDGTLTNKEVLSMGVIMIIAVVFAFIILYYAYLICGNIHRNNTPFMDENVKYLEKIAIWTIVCALVIPLIGGAIGVAIGVDPAQMLAFNPMMLFFAFPVYLLSLILKYGTTLQKESDATL